MVVAITPNLEYLRQDLYDRGYSVVSLGQYNYPIDAMIYTGYSPDSSYISMNNMPSGSNYGILMINAENKSIEEIDQILKTRVYSPLF